MIKKLWLLLALLLALLAPPPIEAQVKVTGLIFRADCTTVTASQVAANETFCFNTGSGGTLTQRALYGHDGVSWSCLTCTTTPSLATLSAIVRADAVDAATALKIGNGTIHWLIYCNASNVCKLETDTASDLILEITTNKNMVIRDSEALADMWTIDPDAASPNAMYTIASGYRMRKSIWFGAGSLSTDGTQCAAPAEVTLASGPKTWTIICTDNDASTIYGNVRMPDSWDGGTITFTHVYVQTAANTGALNGDITAQCRGNGEAVSNTWGTEVAIDDAAVVGTNSIDQTTSAAVTPAGTCAAGDMLWFRYQVDAAGTTTTAATLNHIGFNMEYTVSSLSD
jgi:phosphatidylethanolamine-binding protein (PEBP) family uncharacterized protein